MVEFDTTQITGMTMSMAYRDVKRELIIKIDELDSAEEINDGYCLLAASRVMEKLDDPEEVTILEGGGMDFLHIWLEHKGLHYDAENPEGVGSPEELDFFKDRGRFDFHEVELEFLEKLRG